MSVEPEVTEMWSKDQFQLSQPTGLRKTATIVSAYQITVPPDYTEIQVSQLSDVPGTGSRFTGLPDMHAVTRQFQRLGPTYWIATITYEGTTANASLEPPVINWSDTESSEAVDEDLSGKPIVTVTGEPIDGVTKDIADLTMTVKRYYRSFSPALTLAYRHSVNSDTFNGFAPGLARMTKFSAVEKWNDSDIGYWDVTAAFRFRYPYNTTPAKAWYARVRHEGYYELIGGKIFRAVDDHDEPTTRPVLLKADGTRELDPENAHWLEFQIYQPLPYGSLGLLT